MSKRFFRRFTWVIYSTVADYASVVDCWNGDIVSYMRVGYSAKPEFTNTVNDRLNMYFINSDDDKRYCATLVESRFSACFIHK